MREKPKGQRSLAVLIVAVIVVALIGIVLPLTASAANLTDSQTELAEAYCDFFNEMFEGDAIASLTIAVIDIPVSWFGVIADIGDVLFIGDDIYYYLVGDDLYISRGGAGGRVCYSRSGGGGASRDDLHVTGDVFSDLAQMYNDHYGPKNTAEYISWRTDARWNEAEGSHSNTYGAYGTFFIDGYFCGETSWNEVYLVPFYTNGTDMYHGMYQFHYWQERTTDEDGTAVITLYMEYWDMLNNSEPVTVVVSDDLVNIRYIDVSFMHYDKSRYHRLYDNYTQFIKRSGSSDSIEFDFSSDYYLTNFYSTDRSTLIDFEASLTPAKSFKKTVSAHDEACSYGTACDTGYYCSNKPIEMDFGNVDFSRFSADDTVTLSGDTFYDYTITNNTTGDTTTVNNYITNNYTYPESDSGDNGEEGGCSAVSGNVNVSGDIDVGGQVDINVNIEQSNSGSSSDFLDPVDDYAQYLPEVAPEVTEYLETTYSFLPPEIIGLLIGGIGVAILCRILGR